MMNPESRLSHLQLAGSLALVLGPYFILHDLRWFENGLQAMKAVAACKACCGRGHGRRRSWKRCCGGSVPVRRRINACPVLWVTGQCRAIPSLTTTP